MKKLSKKYAEALKKVEKNKEYSIDEAINLVKDTSTTKFDSTVEVAFKLNVDPKKADQQLRGSIVLPKGTGKTRKVLVITNEAAAQKCIDAKADYVGGVEYIEKIEKENWFDFDVIVATPDMMPKLGRLGKILGPKGLMPNPKTNTVTTTPEKTVEDIKKGMIEYKTDTYGNVHSVIGKVSFSAEDLKENLEYITKMIISAKPQAVKGTYIENVTLSTTMGPGIKLDVNSID